MNELETAFMEKLSDKAANMTPEEKKAMEVIQKAWAGLSSSEKSKFILAYAKNPSQAIDHIMKSINKEELDLGEDKEDLKEIIGKIIKRFSTSGRADAAEKKANALEKKAKDRERLKKAKERIAAAKQKERERKMKKEDLDEAKKPSDDQMIDVMGPAKNSKEAVKLIQKKYKMDAKTAEAEVKRLLKKLLGESLRKDIAQLSAKFPEGSEVTMKHNGKKGKVLSVGKDHVIVGVGNKTHTHKPDELIPESLDEYAKENPMIMKLNGKKVELLKTGSSFKPTFILTVDGKEEGKFGSEKDAMKHFSKMTKEDVEESSSEYGKSVERIKDNKKKSKIKPDELDKLSRLRGMMKKANEEVTEKVDRANSEGRGKGYTASYEKSSKGYRAVLKDPKGKEVYMGSRSYNTKEDAEGEAEAYKQGYFSHPQKATNDRGATNAVHKYRQSVKESLDEKMDKKKYKAQKSKTQNKAFKSLRNRLAGEEVEQIAESNMDALRKIVDDRAMGKINGVKIDMTTANMMLTVHKALNDKNKKALEGLINGDKAQFMRAHALVMKILSK